MQLKIPENFWLFISKKYLDWSEILPKFRGGFISRLQQIREYQRKESEMTYQRSRPPQGTRIEYLYFCLIEIFHAEEFDELLNSLSRLFPGLTDDYNFRSSVKDFRNFSEDLYVSGTQKIGIIDRKAERKFTLPEVQYCEIEALPNEVKYIEVVLHKITPSLIVITFNVYLKERITEVLLNLQERHYLSNTRFFHLIPWGIRSAGYSQDSTDNVMANEIISWLNNLRIHVENCISLFLKGYFMQQTIKDRKPKLPAIEVYGLKGAPNVPESFQKWLKDARGWWHSLGFQFNFDVYTDNKFLLSNINKRSYFSEETSYRFVVLWESFVASTDIKAYGGEKEAILHDTFFILNEIIPPLAIIEYIASARKNFESLRKIIFSSMKYNNWPIFALDRYFKLDRLMKQEYIRLERLSMEFGQSKKTLFSRAEDFKEFELTSFTNVHEEKNFLDVIFESINFNMDFLRKHFQLIKDSFSDHLAIENMKAIFILTIITAIVTFLALMNNWEEIKSLFTLVIKYVKMMALLIFKK